MRKADLKSHGIHSTGHTPIPVPAPPQRARSTSRYLHKAELVAPPTLQPLTAGLFKVDYQSYVPHYAPAARRLLVQQRITDPTYRSADKQKRDSFRLPKQKSAARNDNLWSFTKYEVACAFHKVVTGDMLPPVGVAVALLSHSSAPSVNALWLHKHPQKRWKKITSRLQASSNTSIEVLPWLDTVVSKEDPDYVKLLCQAGVTQEVLDRALIGALSRYSYDIIELLLAFGAHVSANEKDISVAFQRGGLKFVRLLLAASPSAMDVGTWRYCMLEQIRNRSATSSSILLNCLHHRPDLICDSLLLDALVSQNFVALCIVLEYAKIEGFPQDVCLKACELASTVEDVQHRHKFYSALADAKLVFDCNVIYQELETDVKNGHLPLVRLLVTANITLDTGRFNAVAHAVSLMDFEMLEELVGGKMQACNQ